MGAEVASRVLSLAAVLAAACSVLAPSDDELMGGDSTAPDAGIGSASGTGAEAGTGKGGSSPEGGTHGGGTGGAPVGGTGGSLGGAGSGGGGDSGTGGAPDGGANATVSCTATDDCSPPGEYCCAESGQKWECVSVSTTCTGGTQIYCDGPDDCAIGETCCAEYTKGASTYQKLWCVPKATCAPESERRVVCGTNGKCPIGQGCQPSVLLPGYHVCSSPDAGVGGSGGTGSGATGGFGGFGGLGGFGGSIGGTAAN